MAASTPAVQALTSAGMAYTLHQYSRDSSPGAPGFGDQAASALGVDPSRLYKTLVVDAAGTLAVGVVPVAGMLDLRAIGAALSSKGVRMADTAAAERSTGYVVGGISPLGQRRRLPTVIDASVNNWRTVYVSAGRRGLQVELAPADLVALTRAVVAPIRRTA